MRKQALIPLLIGLVVGLFAMKLGWNYVKQIQAKSTGPAGPTAKIVVAKHDLPMGTVLVEGDIALVNMPETLIPKDAMKDPKKALGQTLRQTLPARMPVLGEMLGADKGFRGVIPTGFRAVAVKVDEYTGVAGLLKPGDRVDVVATFTFRDVETSRQQSLSKVVLENVEVRAVGQQFSDSADSAGAKIKEKLSRSVTLLVKPNEMERLQLATSNGEIRLALRAPMDETAGKTQGITMTKLLGSNENVSNPNAGQMDLASALLSKVVKPAKPEEKTESMIKPYEIVVMSGAKTERVYFESRNSDRRVTASGTPKEDKNEAEERPAPTQEQTVPKEMESD